MRSARSQVRKWNPLKDFIQFASVPVSSGGDSTVSISKWCLIILSSGNLSAKHNINLPCYNFGPLPSVQFTVHRGTLLLPSVLYLYLQTVILSVFSKRLHDLNLPSLVMVSRALVTPAVLRTGFTWTCVQKQMPCSG